MSEFIRNANRRATEYKLKQLGWDVDKDYEMFPEPSGVIEPTFIEDHDTVAMYKDMDTEWITGKGVEVRE